MTPRSRVLVVADARFFPPYPEDLPALAATGRQPRAWINEVPADLVFLDRRLLTGPSSWRRRLYRRLPFWIVQVLEAHRVGRDFDTVFCWSVADVTLVLALLLTITRRRIRLIALMTRVSEAKKARLLRLVHRRIERIILPPVTQREIATAELGVPASTLVALPWTLDVPFWSSRTAGARDIVCAAGGEMRDYPTLVAAMSGLDIPCHIAGAVITDRKDWWNAGDGDHSASPLPPNVTVGTMAPRELRDLYERARIVVVPLHPTDSDNGITSMNEAWSMGRPVIVSRVHGQRDAFVDGEGGLFVEPGDPSGLRDAILSLWNDPERASAMGEAGRRRVQATRDHVVFSAGVGAVIEGL